VGAHEAPEFSVTAFSELLFPFEAGSMPFLPAAATPMRKRTGDRGGRNGVEICRFGTGRFRKCASGFAGPGQPDPARAERNAIGKMVLCDNK
jgi:hypothetical protein